MFGEPLQCPRSVPVSLVINNDPAGGLEEDEIDSAALDDRDIAAV